MGCAPTKLERQQKKVPSGSYKNNNHKDMDENDRIGSKSKQKIDKN